MARETVVHKLKCISLLRWTLQMAEGRWLGARILFRSQTGRWLLLVHLKCSLVSVHLRQEAQETRFSQQVVLIITDHLQQAMILNIHFTKVLNLRNHLKNRSQILKLLKYLGLVQTLQSSTHQGLWIMMALVNWRLQKVDHRKKPASQEWEWEWKINRSITVKCVFQTLGSLTLIMTHETNLMIRMTWKDLV